MQEERDRIKELMKPRIKVIAPYPFMPVGVGEQLHSNRNTYHMTTTNYRNEFGENVNQENYVLYSDIENYPHLFKELEWWQERKEEHLPNYVKDNEGVWEVEEWHTNIASPVTVHWKEGESMPLYGYFKPSTEQEYTDFINQQPR